MSIAAGPPPAPCTVDAAARELIDALRDARDALRCFLADKRFSVCVGGNPNVVDRMLSGARTALARAEELT